MAKRIFSRDVVYKYSLGVFDVLPVTVKGPRRMAINGKLWISLGISFFIIFIPKKGGRTMAACKHCGGTGESFGKYCTCVNGKFKKTQDRAQAKAAEELAKHWSQNSVMKKMVDAAFNQPKIKVGVGDWIEYQKAICVVEKVDEHDNSIYIVAVRWLKGGNVGLRTTPMWVDATNLKPMELLEFADMRAARVLDDLETEWIKKKIDEALEKKDKKAFKKLVKLLPQERALPF